MAQETIEAPQSLENQASRAERPFEPRTSLLRPPRLRGLRDFIDAYPVLTSAALLIGALAVGTLLGHLRSDREIPISIQDQAVIVSATEIPAVIPTITPFPTMRPTATPLIGGEGPVIAIDREYLLRREEEQKNKLAVYPTHVPDARFGAQSVPAVTPRPRVVEAVPTKTEDEYKDYLKGINEKLRKAGFLDVIDAAGLTENFEAKVATETNLYSLPSTSADEKGKKLSPDIYKIEGGDDPLLVFIGDESRGRIRSWVFVPAKPDQEVRFISIISKEEIVVKGDVAILTADKPDHATDARIFVSITKGK